MDPQTQQIVDLANTIALQAEAISEGKIPAYQYSAQAKRLLNNVQTLEAWTDDERYQG